MSIPIGPYLGIVNALGDSIPTLKSYTIEAIQNISKRTGYHLELICDSSLLTHASIEIAPVRNPNIHILRWNPELLKDEYLDHICLHEISHIERAWPEIENASYKVPYSSTHATTLALREIEDDLNMAEDPFPFPPYIRRQFTENLHKGLIIQLTSQPVDVRIETLIFEQYPQNRPTQYDYLLSERSYASQLLSRSKRRMLPPKLTDRSLAMNYAYGKALSETLDEPYLRCCNGLTKEELQAGENLYDSFKNFPDNGFQGDINIINEWADILGIREWYEWRDPP